MSAPPAALPAPAAAPRRRTVRLPWPSRLPWRSPDDQPAWARPALLALAALAAGGYAWGIGRAPLHPYYAPAVKSMSESWQAFFYGGYDPAASITLDKLPGAFMVQALSARVFGFHPWSVVLPQVLAGVGAVLVLYRVVRRWQGPAAGLLAAAALAGTPVLAALARSQISDALLVLLLVLAADAWQRAVAGGRLGPLLLCGVWVGLAFQTKMVQAWGVLPAFAVGYLVAAPDRPADCAAGRPAGGTAGRGRALGRRLVRLGLAGLVTLAVSLWQVGLFLLTPASARPYVDGSTNNSLLSMIFEYNLSTRFGISSDTAVSFGPVGGGAGGGGPGGGGFGGPVGAGSTHWWYLLGDQVAPQVGWLYPLAVAGLVAGLAAGLAGRRPAGRTGPRQVFAGYLMWGLWLLVHAAAFSTGRVAHAFYVVALAPPVAALAAGGLVRLCGWHRQGGWRQWLLPAVLAANLGWALYLCTRFPGFLPWLTPVLVAAGGAAVLLLVAAKLPRPSGGCPSGGRPSGGRWVRWRSTLAAGGAALALAGLLVAPAAWASSTVDGRYAGSAIGPAAGPSGILGGPGAGGPGGSGAGGRPVLSRLAGRLPALGGSATELTARTRALMAYLEARQEGEKYLVAAQGPIGVGGQLILAGASVLPMGGFSGRVPFPTADQLATLVAQGKLRYVLVGAGRRFAGRLDGGADAGLRTWVTGHCTQVDPAAYQSDLARADFTGVVGVGGGETLYDCRPGG